MQHDRRGQSLTLGRVGKVNLLCRGNAKPLRHIGDIGVRIVDRVSLGVLGRRPLIDGIANGIDALLPIGA